MTGFASCTRHGRMVRCGHGLPEVEPWPVVPDPSTPCRRATPDTALWLFQRWPTHRAGGLLTCFYPLGHPAPYAYEEKAPLVTSPDIPRRYVSAEQPPEICPFGDKIE
jgi:hypothetical protein